MFHHRATAFGPSVTAIQQHLGAVEKELEKIGRIAGSRTSIAASAASEQTGETISTILADMLDRFRNGGRMAREQAARFSNQAIRLGANYGNDALERVATEVEDRPLITMGVALGVGILIGSAVLRNLNNGTRRRRR
jgi:ElaB/YqjD/DUF883 family membrane-anchored ribosome-binding protein